MSRLKYCYKKYLPKLFFLVVVLFFIGLFTIQHKVLVLSHQQTGEVFLKIPISSKRVLSYKWIHSFEHIPWYEDYQFTKKNQFLLKEIRVAGFGAGIPENKGKTTIENGMVVMTEINENFSEIRWIHSQKALQFIALDKKVIVQGKELPHHQPLQLKIRKESISCH